MKLQIIKFVALIVLLTGWFSCTDGSDCDCYEGMLEVINSGKKSSSFAIDNNIISFSVPYSACSVINEHFPTPDYGGPNAFSPHFWTITLFMAKGIDATKLAPTVTLAPGATIKWIYHTIGAQNFSEQVDYTGIAKIDVLDFSKQVDLVIIAPDGSQVTYKFIATALP